MLVVTPMLLGFVGAIAADSDTGSSLPRGTVQQCAYLENELTMFMHFGICTFTDACGGMGQNSPHPRSAEVFDPSALDTDQWARTALALGARQVCLTAKHTGGFALWNTDATNYSIRASPFGRRTGRDIVAEFVASMRRHKLEPCLYVNLPWDASEWTDTVEKYQEVQAAMLTELLTRYGPISRLWLDDYKLLGDPPKPRLRSPIAGGGAPQQQCNPGPGRFPRTPGTNPGGFPAAFANLTALIRRLQPSTIMLPGPDGCLWPTENGLAGYPVFNFNQGPTCHWCQPATAPPTPTAATLFAPHEQDYSILNPGDRWWWQQGHAYLSAAELFDHYLLTIGRGSTFILNIPPNTTGVVPVELAHEAALLGTSVATSFSPESALARLVNQSVTCGDAAKALELPVPAGGTLRFDAVMLEEDMQLGQHVASYELQICARTPCGEQDWQTITADGLQTQRLSQTIGRKAIEHGFNNSDTLSIEAAGLRFRCTAAFPAGVTQARLKSFSAHRMQPPPGWPPKKPAPPKPAAKHVPLRSYWAASYNDTAPCATRDGGTCATYTTADRYKFLRDEALVPRSRGEGDSETRWAVLVYSSARHDNTLTDLQVGGKLDPKFAPAGAGYISGAWDKMAVYTADGAGRVALEAWYSSALMDFWIVGSAESKAEAVSRGYAQVGLLGYGLAATNGTL